jgi:hypothetical protein
MSESTNTRKGKNRNVPSLKRVQLKLVHIEVWSAAKAGFLVTFATGIATVAAFFGLWFIVGQIGLFASLNSLLAGVFGEGGVNVEESLSLPRVMSFAATLAFVNIVLGTLMTALIAMIFNVIGRITGGIAISFTNN